MLTKLPGTGDQFDNTFVALIVHRQQRKQSGLGLAVIAGQPKVGPHYRLDAAALQRFVELNQAIKITLIGNATGRHSLLKQTLGQRLNTNQAVGERIFRMQPQMNKVNAHNHNQLQGRHWADIIKKGFAVIAGLLPAHKIGGESASLRALAMHAYARVLDSLCGPQNHSLDIAAPAAPSHDRASPWRESKQR